MWNGKCSNFARKPTSFWDKKYEHRYEKLTMSPTVKSFNGLPAIYTMSFCFHFFYFRNLTKHFRSILYVLHALEVLTSHYSERHTIGATVRAIRSRNNHRPGWRTVLGESIVVELWCSIRMSIMRTRGSTRGASSLSVLRSQKILSFAQTFRRPSPATSL